MSLAERSGERAGGAAPAARAPGAPRSGRAAGASRVGAPVLAMIFFALMMFPSGARFHLGPLLLSPLRIFLLAVFVPVVFALVTRFRLRVYDALMAFAVGWYALCILMNYGTGTQFGWLYVLQMFGAYALAQVSVRRPEQVRILFAAVFAVLAIMLPFALHESLTGQRVIHHVVGGFFGVYENIQGDRRLGLFRAAASFAHPILFGVFAAAALSFAWYLPGTLWLRLIRSGVICAATFLSLSAGAVLPLVMQVGLIVGESQTRWLKGRALYLLWGALGAYVFLEFAANSGAFGVFANYLTFNPWNAYIRAAIWHFGIEDVLRHPIFGFVAEEWTRPNWLSHSVDNQWLLHLMRGGFPSAGALALAIILILREMMRRPDREIAPELVPLRRASLFSMIGLVFAATTVAFFDKLEPVFGFYIGLAAAIVRMQEEGPTGEAPPARRAGRRTAAGAPARPDRIDFWSHGSESAGKRHALGPAAAPRRPDARPPPSRRGRRR